MNYFAIPFLALMLSVPALADTTRPEQIQLAQATPTDSAHTLITPNAPNAGRVGQAVPLPQGGTGVTTGGTSTYQTLTEPGGGSAIAVPNGNGRSSVAGPGGRIGTANTTR